MSACGYVFFNKIIDTEIKTLLTTMLTGLFRKKN